MITSPSADHCSRRAWSQFKQEIAENPDSPYLDPVICCLIFEPVWNLKHVDFHSRYGSFHAEPPPPKPRVERQRKAPTKEAKRIMPTQVEHMWLGTLLGWAISQVLLLITYWFTALMVVLFIDGCIFSKFIQYKSQRIRPTAVVEKSCKWRWGEFGGKSNFLWSDTT